MAEPPWEVGTDEQRWQGYLVPGTATLRNHLGAVDHLSLRVMEDRLVELRAEQLRADPIRGAFDRAHLQAVHAHLFQDVYPWAGQLRTVDMAKGDSEFMPARLLRPGLARVLSDELDLGLGRRSLGAAQAARAVTVTLSLVNTAHPFREGNGRVQREFLGQMAAASGHHLDWTGVSAEQNVAVSRAALRGDLEPMYAVLQRITRPAEEASPLATTPPGHAEVDAELVVVRRVLGGHLDAALAVASDPSASRSRSVAYRASAQRGSGQGLER